MMATTKWTQAMDGSPAKTELAYTILNSPRTDGWEDSIPLDPNADWGFIEWQHGPIQEVGRNGILFEELLEFVVIPRLQGFNRDRIPCPEPHSSAPVDQAGCACNGTGEIPNPFRNRETSLAITHLEEALNWLKRRTELRRRQNVEGTFQPHTSGNV